VYMFKYRLSALARLLVYHALAMVFLQGLLSAQVTLPPIIGDSMWTKPFGAYADKCPDPGGSPGFGPMSALAEDAGLLFRATTTGLMVLKADNGEIIERIDLNALVKNYRSTLRVYCDRGATKVLVWYGGTDSLRNVLFSYPSKQILKVFTYEDPVDSWYYNHCAVSPDGRWIIVPKGWNKGQRYILYDAIRDTLLFPEQFKQLLSWSSWSFDGKAQQLAYGQFNYDTTSTLTIFDLTSPDLRTRIYPNTANFIDPKFSADGRYVIATSTKWSGGQLASLPQLSVLESTTGKIIWQISGRSEWWGGNQDKTRHDLVNYAISGDGRYVYAYRNDTIDRAGNVIDDGFFYRLPDVIPIARAVPRTTAGRAPDYTHAVSWRSGYTSFNADLSRAYVEPNHRDFMPYPSCDIVAMQFDDLITGIFGNASATDSSHIIYPNPTTGSLTLNWTNSHETVYWQLLDTSGSILFYASSPVMNGKVQIEIPQSLAIGRYSLLVRDATARTVEHHVVIKN
jgi:hypothetical protein